LFHRAAASRVLAPGVFSRGPAASPRRRPLPSRRWRRRLPVARLQRTSRRPQGLAPNLGPQCRRGFYARSAPVSPPAFSAPSGLGSKTLTMPSHRLRSRSSRCGAACPPRR
jgi:hypothetical protein